MRAENLTNLKICGIILKKTIIIIIIIIIIPL